MSEEIPPVDPTMDEDDKKNENEVEMDDDDKKPVNPWKSPKQDPCNGVVQPRVVPPMGKPTRHTNQLDFLLQTVLKDAMKHRHSWPFHAPVDAVKLNIPEYHNVIKTPMDLRTIEKRLKNVYYYSAKECLEDVNVIFQNCYSFNDRNDDISIMCQNIENIVKAHMGSMPYKEEEVSRPSTKRGPKGRGGAKNVGARNTPVSRRKGAAPSLKSDPKSDDELGPEHQHVLDHFHRAARAVSGQLDEDADDKKDESITKTESPSRESSVSIQQNIADSSLDVEPPIPETPSTSAVTPAVVPKTGTKGVKRKADTTTEDEPGKVTARRESTRPIKKPNLFIDYTTLQPRNKGKITEPLKYCQKIITELLSKKYKSFAWPFYEPVDVEGLKLTDYYDIVQQPMDLGTVKKKLESRQYMTAQEFADDVKLVCSNCLAYNLPDTIFHNHAKDLLRTFEEKFKELPSDDVAENSAVSHAANVLTVQTETAEDERINALMARLKTEQKTLTERLELCRSLQESLYEVAMLRREAKLQGTPAPALTSAQLAQIGVLGLENVNQLQTPTPTAEIVSPAVSLRSSGRLARHEDTKPDAPTPQYSAYAARKTGGRSAVPSTPTTAAAPAIAIPQLSVPANPAPTPAPAAPEPRPYSGRGRRPGSKNKPKNVEPVVEKAKREYDFDSGDESNGLPMPYTELRDLSLIINSVISARGVNEVLRIIEVREKTQHKTNDDEEVEIDFETLQPITLRELEAYVNWVINQKPKKLLPIKDPAEAERKKNEIEKQLRNITGPSSVKTINGAPTLAIPPKKNTNDDSSSDSSDSSDDDSSSSSSDSSDSDSAGPRLDELTSRRRPINLPKPPIRNGFGNVPVAQPSASIPERNTKKSPTPQPKGTSQPVAVPPVTSSAPKPEMKRPDAVLSRSHVHAGAKPLLENDKSIGKSGGIGVSILDSLLPDTPKKPDAMDAYRRKNNEKRPDVDFEDGDTRRGRETDTEKSRKAREEELARINRLKEEARRKRDEESGLSMTDQMEMMANFEASF